MGNDNSTKKEIPSYCIFLLKLKDDRIACGYGKCPSYIIEIFTIKDFESVVKINIDNNNELHNKPIQLKNGKILLIFSYPDYPIFMFVNLTKKFYSVESDDVYVNNIEIDHKPDKILEIEDYLFYFVYKWIYVLQEIKGNFEIVKKIEVEREYIMSTHFKDALYLNSYSKLIASFHYNFSGSPNFSHIKFFDTKKFELIKVLKIQRNIIRTGWEPTSSIIQVSKNQVLVHFNVVYYIIDCVNYQIISKTKIKTEIPWIYSMKKLSNNYIIMSYTKDNFFSQHFMIYYWNKNYLKKIKELKFDKTIRFFIEGKKGNIFAYFLDKDNIFHKLLHCGLL